MITTHQNYISEIPTEMHISEDRIILANTLTSSKITVQENANLTFIAFLTKGWEENQILDFHLEGENSKVTFLGIIFGANTEKFPFETISNHQSQGTAASYHTKAVLTDKAQIHYKGNLIIPKPAQLTDAYLSHDTLLLSDEAKTISIPCLEIEADDVTAGHAATMGRVDEEALFYLRSRGLTPKEASQMLIQGFLQADLHKISSEEIRQILTAEIQKLS